MTQKRIQFLYQPNGFETQQHAVEKSIDGKKHRYLRGVSSGTQVDGHGERVTSKCIKSIMEQGNNGNILLYADRHGVAYTEDIGIMESQKITPMGDWETEFRLYDEADGVGRNTMETVEKVWKQVNGLPPYTVPKQKGFSIEGFIPDNGIIEMSGDGKRVIDQVTLDGVVLVPRPAYKTSIAHAVYKALDERTPWNNDRVIEKNIENSFQRLIETEEVQNSYYRKRYLIQDKLEEQIETIMSSDGVTERKEILERLFEEYARVMIDLITKSTSMFKGRASSEKQPETSSNLLNRSQQRVILIKSMMDNIDAVIEKLN